MHPLPLVRTSLVVPLLLATVFLSTMGCGGESAARFAPKTPFPTKAALAAVASTPAPPLVVKDAAPAVAYDVEAAPEPEAKTPSTIEAQLLATYPGLAWTPSLRCVAQEISRFYLMHKRGPDPRLAALIEGACGATAEGLRFTLSTGTAPASINDADVVKAFAPKLSTPPAGQKAGGAFLLRKGDAAVLGLVTARTPPSILLAVTPDGQVSVTGTAKTSTALMQAYVNRGPSGVAPCEPRADLPAPNFGFRCTMMDGDATAWIDVVAHEPGRVLSTVQGRVLARRDPQKPVSYAGHPADESATAQTPAALLQHINRVRQEAKLPPLTLENKESATATQVAGHYFAATEQNDAAKTDLICLGMMAGWDVEGGLIKDGNFYSGLLYGRTSAAAWVDDAKDTPSARLTILDPRASSVAIGAISAEGGAGLGALVATYTFWGQTDHQADVKRLLQRVNAARAQKNLAPVGMLPESASLKQIMGKVAAGETEPMEGLNEAMTNAAYATGGSAQGWVAAATEIDALEIPQPLLGTDGYRLAISITHYRPKDSAWGFYLAYMIKLSSAAVTAENGTATRPAAVAF
jgi:hypothetical protein